ncbi:MAG: RNA polymerase sigma factor [Planctomycetes bacterium]|nr:RNA polymerase sigma factor [Planctomycetota bacterium]
MNRCSDSGDVRRAQKGDQDAFRRIMERYQGHVSRLLWRFTRDKNSHEELVQESFVQVYLSLHTYKARAPFEHWLSRIVTRAGYRFWKQSKRHMHVSLHDQDWKQLSQDQADPTNPQQAAELVHHLLSKLPPRDRLVLTLRYLDQCSVAETAQRTGWTPSLVKVQTYRAKQKLRKLLKNTDIEFEV